MKSSELGKSGIQVSRLGLGCVTFGREIDEQTAFSVADHAFERGITLFDTADVYGGGASETVLGRWTRARGNRDRVVLCTKVGGPSPSDPADRGCSRARILRNIESSLRRLQTDHVDLYLTHCWDAAVAPEETTEALDLVVRQGKALAVGCSNYSGMQLRNVLEVAAKRLLARMNVIQVPLSLVLGRAEMDQHLRPLGLEQAIGIMTYSPLGAGFLTGKYGQGNVIPPGSRFDVIPGHQPLYFTEGNYKLVERLRRMAEAEGLSMSCLAIAWVLNQPGVTTTLIGARNVAHVDQALEALHLKSLPPALLAL